MKVLYGELCLIGLQQEIFKVNIHEILVEDAVTSKVKTTSSDTIIRLRERISSATMTMYSAHS
jgi:hypothetical protein